MPRGWPRYGSEIDIFRKRPVLDCIREVQDNDRFLSFRFGEVESRDLQQRMKNARQLCLIVSGPNGSGRSAMARWLVGLYKHAQGQHAFAFGEYDPGDVKDVPTACKNLLQGLAEHTAEVLDQNVDEGPAKALLTALTSPMIGTFDVTMQTRLQAYSRTMDRANARFGCILENVGSRELLTSAYTIFENTSAILVCTVTDAERERVAKEFLDSHPDVIDVQLQPLLPGAAWKLLENRWTQGKAIFPLPLDSAHLQESFERPLRTIGRALELLSGMFEMKLANCGEGDVWPKDPALRLSREQIEDFIRIQEDWRRYRS